MDIAELKAAMRGDLFYDLRNVYKPWEVSRFGFRYFGVGIGEPPKAGEAAAEARPNMKLASGG